MGEGALSVHLVILPISRVLTPVGPSLRAPTMLLALPARALIRAPAAPRPFRQYIVPWPPAPPRACTAARRRWPHATYAPVRVGTGHPGPVRREVVQQAAAHGSGLPPAKGTGHPGPVLRMRDYPRPRPDGGLQVVPRVSSPPPHSELCDRRAVVSSMLLALRT